MIVITGGSGFIGSALLWGFNKLGIKDIVIVDVLDDYPDKLKNIEHLKFLEIIDAWEFLKVLKKFDKIDFIFHFGAITDTTMNDEERMMKYNYEYSVSLGEFCREKGIRLIYASSATTYGKEQNFDDSESNLEKLNPLNIYGKSKHLFDLWVKKEGLFKYFTSLKFFNVYGPNEYHKGKMSSFILQGYKQAEGTGKIKLFKSQDVNVKDGEQKRDFVYIKDVVDAIIFIYEKNLKGVYNIGTGIPRSFIDIVNSLSVSMGKKINIEFIEIPEKIKDAYQYYTCANIVKLRSFGYDRKFYSLEEGVEDYVKNYLKNAFYLGKNYEIKEEI